MLYLLLTLLGSGLGLDDHSDIEIGTAIEAKVEHFYTCSTHTAIYYEREPGQPWAVTEVDRSPTGRNCEPGEPFAPREEGM